MIWTTSLRRAEPGAGGREGHHGLREGLDQGRDQGPVRIDVEYLDQFFKSPSSKMDLSQINLGPLGTCRYSSRGHAKLDGYLGLAPNHATLPNGGLGDSVEFDKNTFAPYKNTVQMTKMMFLDGGKMFLVLACCPR